MRTVEEIRAMSTRVYELWGADRPYSRDAELERSYLYAAWSVLSAAARDGASDDKIRASLAAMPDTARTTDELRSAQGFASACRWLLGGAAPVDEHGRKLVAA